MAGRILTDELWARLEPLLPAPPPRRFRYPGRRRTDYRAALEGILFVMRTGVAFNDLPTAAFGASGATCWRRLTEWHAAGVWQRLHERLLTEWHAAGVWQRLHERLLAELRAAGRLDLAHAVVGSSHLRALKGGTTPVPAQSTGVGPAASIT
ncbi:hypothetical protein GCM10010166_45970 [Couchioplanes caeruleus subsp. azureus]|nr:hypothetical protein GCM10010166_45970 [Couchioplanes caeruleus subsp. azureus]